MTRPTVRIKVQPRSRVKVSTIPKFPAQVIAGDGIDIAVSGGVFTFSIDTDYFPNFSDALPFTAGDIFFAFDTTNVHALHDVATGNALISGGVGLAPSWGKVTSSHVNSTTGSGAFVFATGPTITSPVITGGSIDNTPIGGTTRAAGAFTSVAIGATWTATYPLEISTATAACFIEQTNSGSTWAMGPTTSIDSGGWGLFSVTAGAYRLRINNTGLVTLGQTSAASAGALNFENATSGNITIAPPTGALGTNTLTLPAATDTLVGRNTTDTLTNKTLTSPVISGGTINNATIGGTTRAVGSFSGIGIGAVWSAASTQPLEITTSSAAAFISQTNSGSSWLMGPTTGISSAGWGLFSVTAGAYRISIDNNGNISFPAYGTGILKTASGVVSTGAGVTDLAATTANRLFGTNGSGAPGLVTLPAAGLMLSAGALALANDLSALEGLGSTGIAVRTTTDTWAQRTITGTANEITVTNGDGVSGNPTLSLPTAITATGKTITSGTFSAPTINGGTHTAITSLGIRSTGSGAFDLTLANTENLTAGRTLTLKLNDAARTIDIAGNITFAGAASHPAIAQGDLWYGSATGVLSALAKDTGTSRFLKNSGTSNNPAWARPAASDLSDGTTGTGTVLLFTAVREKLAADRTYYVRTDGSDSNTGLANSSGGAFLTVQKAVDTVCGLDLATWQATIQVGDGTYTGTVILKPYLGALAPILQGNNGTPANVSISVTSNDAITVQGGSWKVRDLKVSTTTSGSGIVVTGAQANLEFQNINFGACFLWQINPTLGGTVTATGNYAVSGSATGHIIANLNGIADLRSRTITYSNAPNFSFANFTATTLGVIVCNGMTFTNGGTVTGQRYLINGNSDINTAGAGATYIPGNAAGTTTTGGQYE